MLVRFWGTRGSLPVALTAAQVREKVVAALVSAKGRDLATREQAEAFVDAEMEFEVGRTFGGNSSCVEIESGSAEYVLCDLGSGARPFANGVLKRHGGAGQTFNVFLSHLHWDHIMGFPFFTPAYIPGHRIRIHGGHGEVMEQALRRQHGAPSFPVEFARLGATLEFVSMEPGRTYEVAGLAVTAKKQRHGGDSYGYRFEQAGRSVVYSTDSEHKLEDLEDTNAFVEFFRDADLVIFDAQYSLADAVSVKEDWGHSSNVVGVELCQMAGARHLCLYHHEPTFDDARIAAVLRETRRFEALTRTATPLAVSAAWDGLEIRV
jgi:phosphoribosyl 1,2-cyclic phosphodiesterase